MTLFGKNHVGKNHALLESRGGNQASENQAKRKSRSEIITKSKITPNIMSEITPFCQTCVALFAVPFKGVLDKGNL